MPTPDAAHEGREVVFTRIIAAPRALVFRAWTDPKYLAEWWGPKGFTNPVCEVDVRPGGAIRIVMRAPADVPPQYRGDHPMSGTFHEIVEPERLVFTTAVDNAGGERVLEPFVTVTFVEQRGQTTLTVTVRIVKATTQAASMLAGMEQGWGQSLDRLAAFAAEAAAFPGRLSS